MLPSMLSSLTARWFAAGYLWNCWKAFFSPCVKCNSGTFHINRWLNYGNTVELQIKVYNIHLKDLMLQNIVSIEWSWINRELWFEKKKKKQHLHARDNHVERIQKHVMNKWMSRTGLRQTTLCTSVTWRYFSQSRASPLWAVTRQWWCKPISNNNRDPLWANYERSCASSGGIDNRHKHNTNPMFTTTFKMYIGLSQYPNNETHVKANTISLHFWNEHFV